MLPLQDRDEERDQSGGEEVGGEGCVTVDVSAPEEAEAGAGVLRGIQADGEQDTLRALLLQSGVLETRDLCEARHLPLPGGLRRV